MKTAIYLDNNASTPVAPEVVQQVERALREQYGNPMSETHSFGWYANELVEIARERVARLLNAQASDIVFTSGATESNSQVLLGFGLQALEKTNRRLGSIITQATEHKAVLSPAANLAKFGFESIVLPVDSHGKVLRDEYEEALSQAPQLVSIMYGNNETGTVDDLLELIDAAHKAGALFHCDATQAIGKIPFDVEQLPVDFLSLAAHKMYGPKGVGALYIRNAKRSDVLAPLFDGARNEQGLRSGTANVPGIVGLGAAAELCVSTLEEHTRHLQQLEILFRARLQERLGELPLNGHETDRLPGTLNLRFPGTNSAALLGKLSSKLACSAGSACTSEGFGGSHVLAAMGLPLRDIASSLRFGIGRYTTEEEIVTAVDILSDTVKQALKCPS